MREEAERREREEEAKRRAEEQARRLLEKQRDVGGQEDGCGRARVAAAPGRGRDENRGAASATRSVPRWRPGSGTGGRRRSGKLTVAQALNEEDREERARSLAAARRAREKLRQQQRSSGR